MTPTVQQHVKTETPLNQMTAFVQQWWTGELQPVF